MGDWLTWGVPAAAIAAGAASVAFVWLSVRRFDRTFGDRS